MEQKVIYLTEADYGICAYKIEQITKELNQQGFELVALNMQCDENKFIKPTHAVLVFSKK